MRSVFFVSLRKKDMATTISQYPDLISPVFMNNNKFVMQETGAEYFIVTFSGDISDSFTIPTNVLGIAELNVRGILENYIYSQIAKVSSSPMPNALKSYTIAIESSTGITIEPPTTYRFFNGALQDWETNEAGEGFILNNTKGGLFIHRDDEITLQKMTNNTIVVVDASTAANNVPESATSYEVEGVTINIIDQDPRFTPFRFAYVNQHGGTDYANFDLADRESYKLKRTYYESDNNNDIYTIVPTQALEVTTRSLTAQQSDNLKYLWMSPMVELIKDGVHYPVNITNTTAKSLRKKQANTLDHTAKFSHKSKFNNIK